MKAFALRLRERNTVEAKSMEAVLTARYLLYSFFGRTFEGIPNEEYLSLLSAPELREAFMLMVDDELGERASRLLAEIDCVLSSEPFGAIERLSGDYTRLFVGPDTLPGGPWECVHRTGRSEVLQPSTLEVRRFYRKAGYLPVAYKKVSDDFLPIEVDFMSKMAKDAMGHYASGAQGLKTSLALQQEFLEKHLLLWIGSYSTKLEESGLRINYGFYLAAVSAFAEFCKLDFEVVGSFR